MHNPRCSEISPCASLSRDDGGTVIPSGPLVISSVVEKSHHDGRDAPAEVKASSPIRTSLFEREGSMWGRLKRPSPRPINLIEESRSDDSDLCHEMITTFGFSQDQMHRAAERFHLGRSKSGKTIYWMIDDIGRTLDGRIGDAWVSTMLKARYPTAAPYVHFDHCLFGLHQISECEQKPIGIVESERSAVLLSELCPELIWLAYIYGCNLNVNSFEPLQGRKITLFPRTDSVRETYLSFLELADQVKRCYKDIDLSVSRFLEDNANDDQKRREIDLLQYLLE